MPVRLTPEIAPALSETRTQNAHGLTVPQAVRLLNGDYVTALANDPTTLAIGIVSAVGSVNELTVTFSGRIPVAGHGLSANALLFVSSGTPGALTATRLINSGQYQNPIARVYDANTLLVLPWRYEQLPEIANRIVLTSPAIGETSSTAHALQIGADGTQRTAFSGNRLTALTSGGALDTYGLNCSVLLTQTAEFSSIVRAVVLPRTAGTGSIINTQNAAIFYSNGANAFTFRENGAWVTGSGLA